MRLAREVEQDQKLKCDYDNRNIIKSLEDDRWKKGK